MHKMAYMQLMCKIGIINFGKNNCSSQAVIVPGMYAYRSLSTYSSTLTKLLEDSLHHRMGEKEEARRRQMHKHDRREASNEVSVLYVLCAHVHCVCVHACIYDHIFTTVRAN